jgi:hypothetical protein
MLPISTRGVAISVGERQTCLFVASGTLLIWLFVHELTPKFLGDIRYRDSPVTTRKGRRRVRLRFNSFCLRILRDNDDVDVAMMVVLKRNLSAEIFHPCSRNRGTIDDAFLNLMLVWQWHRVRSGVGRV